MTNKSEAILSEVKKVIVGKDEVVEKVFLTILSGGHVLLEDVPGVGKTTLALAFSKAMSMSYKRVQFTPDTMASDVLGFSVYNKETGKFDYKKGAVYCNFFLGDEINRTSAKTQAALLEAMEELKITVDGKTLALPDPFVCIATQNPLGSAGTHALPDSQLDRFMVRLSLGYPSVENTVEIVKDRFGKDPLDSVSAVATTSDIVEMKEAVSKVHIDDELIEYVASLCDKTRGFTDVEQGVSPRAALATVQMAKAKAYLSGRDYVVPQDINYVFVDVCAHRVILTPKARIKKTSAQTVLTELLNSIPTPSPRK
ncbi:MAG: MoxR family ATPase [Clostridia bacterium]|nr:MoxR family ATPase [Clostridia bacterium]